MNISRAWHALKKKKLIERYRSLIGANPINARYHRDFGLVALDLGEPWLAVSELKTSWFLGAHTQEVEQAMERALKLANCESLDHNMFYRFRSLQMELEQGFDGGHEFSILDIGGGEGGLASFVRTRNYFLAEPGINGIKADTLPFDPASFDAVVACHVLEHIPPDSRDGFLEGLCRLARKSVYLLNPFQIQDLNEKERLKLHVDITGAWWAKEHLECSLPSVDSVRDFASRRGFTVHVTPNGSAALSFAWVYVDYFARLAGREVDLSRVNIFMNRNLNMVENSQSAPNSYLVRIDVNGA